MLIENYMKDASNITTPARAHSCFDQLFYTVVNIVDL